jgi:tetratricopeptide (TPR) repeat protein
VLTLNNGHGADIWDASTGRRGATVAPEKQIKRASFSADSRRVLTVIEERTARVWDAATGDPLTLDMRFDTSSLDASFSRDGRYIVTSGLQDMDANGVRIWDASTGHPLTPLFILPDGHEVQMSPDGRRLLTTGWGAAQLWDLVPEARDVADLELLGRLISGHMIDDKAMLIPCPPEAIIDAYRTIRSKYPSAVSTPPGAAVRWHKLEAARARKVRHWFAAAWHLERLNAARPGEWKPHASRGYALANIGLWKDSAVQYSLATALGSDDVTDWSQEAMTTLKSGDVRGYRVACARTLDRFGKTEDIAVLGEVVNACIMAPDSATDLHPYAKRLESLAAKNKKESAYATMIGASLYREGRNEQAIPWLTREKPAGQRDDAALAFAYLAMSYHHLGRHQEAKDCLEKAIAAFKEASDSHYLGGSPTYPWYRLLPIDIILAEARAMIDLSPPQDGPHP